MGYYPYDFLLTTINTYAVGIGMFVLLFFAALVAGQYMIFQKAGEPGWKALIPIYNEYTLYKIVNCTNLFVINLVCRLILLIPFFFVFSTVSVLLGIAQLVIHILFSISLSKAFGREEGFFIGLLFLYPIFLLILGFGSSNYINRYAYQHQYNDPWQNDYQPPVRYIPAAQVQHPQPDNHAEHAYRNASPHPQPEAYHDLRSIPSDPSGESLQEPCYLFGERGAMSGKNIRLKSKMMIGTQADKCGILYPRGTPGISRKHCTIRYRNGIVTVTDENSTYGTWIDNRKLPPGVTVKLNQGHRLSLGSPKETLILRK